MVVLRGEVGSVMLLFKNKSKTATPTGNRTCMLMDFLDVFDHCATLSSCCKGVQTLIYNHIK